MPSVIFFERSLHAGFSVGAHTHTVTHTPHHHQVSCLARSQHDIQGPFQQSLQTTKEDVNVSFPEWKEAGPRVPRAKRGFAVQEAASEHRADGELRGPVRCSSFH